MENSNYSREEVLQLLISVRMLIFVSLSIAFVVAGFIVIKRAQAGLLDFEEDAAAHDEKILSNAL